MKERKFFMTTPQKFAGGHEKVLRALRSSLYVVGYNLLDIHRFCVASKGTYFDMLPLTRLALVFVHKNFPFCVRAIFLISPGYLEIEREFDGFCLG